MIKVVIFDLDGTLIQTEILKAQSYAQSIHSLTKKTVSENKVMDGFKKYIGLSRTEVVEGLVEEFQPELEQVFPNDDDESIRQMVLARRFEIYEAMINDPALMSNFFCPYNQSLLNAVHTDHYQTALATMSNETEVEKVLKIMNIKDQFNTIFTRDKVNKGKPDPEIYLAIKDYFQVKPEECLVIEDSVNGIKAGLNAGMFVFAVTNSITRESVHAANLLPPKFIVDDLTELKTRVYDFFKMQSEF